MKQRLTYAIFWASYHFNNLVNKFRKKTTHQYMVVTMGRYPMGFNQVIKEVMSTNSPVRYSISVNNVVVMFKSNHDFHTLDDLLKDMMIGRVDNYLLIKMSSLSKHFYSLNMNQKTYRELFSHFHPDHRKSPFQMLDDMQMVINTLQIQRNSFNKLLKDVQQELIAEEQEELETLDNILSPLESTKVDLEAEANRILDKVRKQGVDSLTDDEKDILTKYGK